MPLQKVTIRISNSELNALEDFLTIEMSPVKKEKVRKKILKLWSKMVREFDKGRTYPKEHTLKIDCPACEFSEQGICPEHS